MKQREAQPVEALDLEQAWLHLELDFGFDGQAPNPMGFISFGITAHDHAQATAIVEQAVLERFPKALIVRYLQSYRMTEEDIGDEISPKDRSDLRRAGVWYESDVKYWG